MAVVPGQDDSSHNSGSGNRDGEKGMASRGLSKIKLAGLIHKFCLKHKEKQGSRVTFRLLVCATGWMRVPLS